jgi:hypothetical protein
MSDAIWTVNKPPKGFYVVDKNGFRMNDQHIDYYFAEDGKLIYAGANGTIGEFYGGRIVWEY